MLVTALVTPWDPEGLGPDLAFFARTVSFQLGAGAGAVLVAGVSGEGPLLDEAERLDLLDAALEVAPVSALWFDLGAGRIEQVVARGERALERGVLDLVLADPPVAGASSAALRERWHGAVARALPEARLLVAAQPGRAPTELLPEDLARLREEAPNVVGLMDGSGRLARMARVRALCGEELALWCADDAMLRDALVDPAIRANGSCSATANLLPTTMAELVESASRASPKHARVLHDLLVPLFALGNITVEERLALGDGSVLVPQRSRDPVPLKCALAELGFGTERVRAPLAPLQPAGRMRVRAALRLVARRRPEVFEPLAAAFGLDVARRLDVEPDAATAAG